jgi:hypothetical protein
MVMTLWVYIFMNYGWDLCVGVQIKSIAGTEWEEYEKAIGYGYMG